VKKPSQVVPGRWIHIGDKRRHGHANGPPDKSVWRRVRRAGKRRRTPEHIEVFKTDFWAVLEGVLVPFVAALAWLQYILPNINLAVEWLRLSLR